MNLRNRHRAAIAYVLCGILLVALGCMLAWVLAWHLDSSVSPLNSSAFYTSVISILTLEATIAIALLVFRLQTSREKRKQSEREQAAAKLILSDLEIVFEYLLLTPHGSGLPGAAIPLKEGFAAYAGELQQILSKGSMEQLIMIISATQDPSLSDDELGYDGGLPSVALPFVREVLLPIARTSYARLLANIADWRVVVDESTHALIAELSLYSAESLKPYDKGQAIFNDKQGDPVIEFDSETRHYRLQEGDVLLCDGSIDPNSYSSLGPVSEGFVCTSEYIGSVLDGKRNGEGTSFSRVEHRTLAEGEWKDDELVSGIEYEWIIAIPGDVDLEAVNSEEVTVECDVIEYQQLNDNRCFRPDIERIARFAAEECFPLEEDEFEATLKALGILYVADVRVSGDMHQIFNVRPIGEVTDVSNTDREKKC